MFGVLEVNHVLSNDPSISEEILFSGRYLVTINAGFADGLSVVMPAGRQRLMARSVSYFKTESQKWK